MSHFMAYNKDVGLGMTFCTHHASQLLSTFNNVHFWTPKAFRADPSSTDDCPKIWKKAVEEMLRDGMKVYKKEIKDVHYDSVWSVLRPDLLSVSLVTLVGIVANQVWSVSSRC